MLFQNCERSLVNKIAYYAPSKLCAFFGQQINLFTENLQIRNYTRTLIIIQCFCTTLNILMLRINIADHKFHFCGFAPRQFILSMMIKNDFRHKHDDVFSVFLFFLPRCEPYLGGSSHSHNVLQPSRTNIKSFSFNVAHANILKYNSSCISLGSEKIHLLLKTHFNNNATSSALATFNASWPQPKLPEELS